MDRHEIWRMVARNEAVWRDGAPEGYGPVVQVFLAGKLEPVVVEIVETSQDDDDPWVRFQAINMKAATFSHDDYTIWVHENMIERIEIRFERKGKRPEIGFRHRVSDEDHRGDIA